MSGAAGGPNRGRRPDLLPVLLLVAIVLVLLGGWWIFPRLHNAVALQDCTAAGRTDCNGPGH